MIVGINGRQGSGKDTLGMLMQALSLERGVYKDDPLLYLKNYEGMPNRKGGWRIVKFADKLKEIASILTGIPRERFEDQDFKLTTLGPEWASWRVYFKRDGEQYGQDFLTEAEAVKWEANERRALQWSKSLKTEVVKVPMTVREFLQRLGTEGLRNGLHQNTWVNALFADYKDRIDYTDEEEPEEINRGKPNWIITDMRFPNEFEEVKRRGGLTVRIDRPDNPYKQSTHKSETALDGHLFDIRFDNQFGLEGLVKQAGAILQIAKLRVCM